MTEPSKAATKAADGLRAEGYNIKEHNQVPSIERSIYRAAAEIVLALDRLARVNRPGYGPGLMEVCAWCGMGMFHHDNNNKPYPCDPSVEKDPVTGEAKP